MKRILIVDDHPLVRAGFARLIEDEPDLQVCGECADEGKALQLVASCRPDLAIIDLSLAGGSGLDLIERVHATHPGVLMLVASMHDEQLFAERVLAAGALGYINKQEAAANIIMAIRRVLGGEIYLDSTGDRQGIPGDAFPSLKKLTNRELEIFELIGRGVTSGNIASQLHLSVKTIESHRENIKRKLGLNSAQELTRSAMNWLMQDT